MDAKGKPDLNLNIAKILAGILKELGLPSFMFFCTLLVFLFYGTSEQKTEFIDSFVLLKTVPSNPFPFVLVVVFLLFVLFITIVQFNVRIQILKDENSRIGDEKTLLQNQLIKKELESSKKLQP